MWAVDEPIHSWRLRSLATLMPSQQRVPRRIPRVSALCNEAAKDGGQTAPSAIGVLIGKAPWCLFIKEAINAGNEPFYLNSISHAAKACYHEVPLALMKGDEAGRRLPADRSRAGLETGEAFPLRVEFLERVWEWGAKSCLTVSHESVWLCIRSSGQEDQPTRLVDEL
ncbi:hypothetical protein EYF80_027645 [Liparis tanakae]|uniref:Uncharacterized protein n=1 Tax=Liparis tanakae TaxID=230148 RepID=A0A4Z2HA61_9TELE|nr:hypothetical protein EYF80_027645 [Liparis tanakae]